MQPSSPQPARRLARHIARSGICSRRQAEELIADGRVKLAGKVARTPATVVSDCSLITVDDKPLNIEPTRLWLYHKPRGLLTTAADTHNRPTVFEQLAKNKNLPKVITVGRLDKESEGLLLLTNDGGLARRLTLPGKRVPRRYRVQIAGKPSRRRLQTLRKGAVIEGFSYLPIRISGGEEWYNVTLFEGKNREIRRMLKWCGLRVLRLIRISHGQYELGDLKIGEVREVVPPPDSTEEAKDYADNQR